MAGLTPDLFASLSDATALRAFFTALGYAAQEQITYSARTLAWPDNVAVDLRGRAFEVLADTDDGFFQVLLLPPHQDVQGITAALLQRLYATIEQRGNEAILVLPTADWGTLELMLLVDLRPIDDRQGPPQSFLRFGFDPQAVRPHLHIALELLDVHGTGPGEATERVTRAFRRAQQERFFRSVNCFSTYYLERRIFTDPTPAVQETWVALAAQMPSLQSVLAGADATSVLMAMGWTIVPSPLAGQPARLRCETGDVALVAVLPPEHPLDQQMSETSYPQLELIAALEQERQTAGLTWAILTNGRTWRLYSHLTASISGAFYEVDLADLLAFGSADDLRYLAGFFGVAGLSGPFVGAVFASSQMLAKEVGENLKQVVFSQVFGLLANAIADDLKRRGEYDGREGQRRVIFRTTMILLYRILFVLYAESMRLLPTMHPPYYANSLTYLLSDIALQPFTATHLRKPLTPTSYWAWNRVRDLCEAMSAGRPEWGVPKYNGGLFSSGAAVDGVENPHKAPHRLLAQVQLGAMDVCQALDLLGRDPLARAGKTQDEVRRLIDYAGLDVRRLGSMYEGLLEFQLVETPAGDLELKHTREERKASGSYYTPDYIVAYIVEQAVGPVLDERARQFAAIMERLPAARRSREQATRAEGNERISIATAKAHSDAARATLARMEHEAVESLLDLKILDPAMGSGHFLVSAVNFVTDRLIVILDRHRASNPILARLEGIRTQIRASLREQGVDALIADEQLNNVNLLRRLVMKRCVFGVDLNDMAVELARLSLWLNSFTVGAPLNFLDHHLKWGNSLIGARVQAVQQAMEGTDAGGQLALFTGGSAFKEMLDVTRFIEELVEIADANAQQVEQSESLYRSYEQSVVPVKRLLDLWVSRSFGSKEASELTTLYSGSSEVVKQLKAALTSGAPLAHPPHQRALDRARELFAQHRFLHWDLDFPEVFIDLHTRAWKPAEQMGFDAVVGNPPYLVMEDMLSEDRNYYYSKDSDKVKLFKTATQKSNLFALFWEKSTQVSATNGLISLITPYTWLSTSSFKELRKLFIVDFTIKEVMVFPVGIFEEADIATGIAILKNCQPIKDDLIYISDLRTIDTISIKNSMYNIKKKIPIRSFQENQDMVFSLEWSDSRQDIISRMGEFSLELDEISFIDRGCDTANNQKYTGHDYIAPMNSKRLLLGEDFGRYSLVWRGSYLYYLPEEMKQENATARPGDPKRFEVKRKIVLYRFIENDSRFIAVIDDNGLYTLGSTYVMSLKTDLINIYFILSIINSKAISFFNSALFSGVKITLTELQRLPIRRIAFTTPAGERAALVDAAKRAIEMAARAPTAGRPPTTTGVNIFAERLPSITPPGPPASGGEQYVDSPPASGGEQYVDPPPLAGGPGGVIHNDNGSTTRSEGEPTDWRGWRTYWAALWAWADARLPQLADGTPDTAHEQSDVVHDVLAHLAERMIALHKQKQASAATFTGWLEQETGSVIEEWSLKTVIHSFWEQPWNEIERAIQKNRGKCVQAAGMRGKQADIAIQPLVRVAQGHWEIARRSLTPTIAAIIATDRLIDLLVYRLYGLTDAEIDLVEGG